MWTISAAGMGLIVLAAHAEWQECSRRRCAHRPPIPPRMPVFGEDCGGACDGIRPGRPADRAGRPARCRRRSTATTSRSGRSCRSSSPANPARCWRPAAAPASMWCISPATAPTSPGGRATSARRICEASRPGARSRACRTSARRCGSILPIPHGFPAADGSGPAKLLAVFCANVIHIAPWRVAEGLFAGAARYLRDDGRLFLYGPFKRDGKHTAISNAVFDTSLRAARTPNGACAMSAMSSNWRTRRRAGVARNRTDAGQQSDSDIPAFGLG